MPPFSNVINTYFIHNGRRYSKVRTVVELNQNKNMIPDSVRNLKRDLMDSFLNLPLFPKDEDAAITAAKIAAAKANLPLQ